MPSIVTLPVSVGAALLAEDLFANTGFVGKASLVPKTKCTKAKIRVTAEASQIVQANIKHLEEQAFERAYELHERAKERWKSVAKREEVIGRAIGRAMKRDAKAKEEKPVKPSAREQRAVALAGSTPIRMVPVAPIPVPLVNDARAKVRAEIAARRAAAGL